MHYVGSESFLAQELIFYCDWFLNDRAFKLKFYVLSNFFLFGFVIVKITFGHPVSNDVAKFETFKFFIVLLLECTN